MSISCFIVDGLYVSFHLLHLNYLNSTVVVLCEHYYLRQHIISLKLSDYYLSYHSIDNFGAIVELTFYLINSLTTDLDHNLSYCCCSYYLYSSLFPNLCYYHSPTHNDLILSDILPSTFSSCQQITTSNVDSHSIVVSLWHLWRHFNVIRDFVDDMRHDDFVSFWCQKLIGRWMMIRGCDFVSLMKGLQLNLLNLL